MAGSVILQEFQAMLMMPTMILSTSVNWLASSKNTRGYVNFSQIFSICVFVSLSHFVH